MCGENKNSFDTEYMQMFVTCALCHAYSIYTCTNSLNVHSEKHFLHILATRFPSPPSSSSLAPSSPSNPPSVR